MTAVGELRSSVNLEMKQQQQQQRRRKRGAITTADDDDIIIDGDVKITIAPFFKKVDKKYRRNKRGRNSYDYNLSTSAFYIDNLNIVRKYTTNKCVKFTRLKLSKKCGNTEIILDNNVITIGNIVNAIVSVNDGVIPVNLILKNMVMGHVFNFILTSFLRLKNFKSLPVKCSVTNSKLIKTVVKVTNPETTMVVKRFH